MEPTVTRCDDLVGVGLPDEGFVVICVGSPDEAIDGGLEIDERMEDAVFEPPPGQLCEEALDGVEP